jgi:transcriptional regulator with XRE-family HTH domain
MPFPERSSADEQEIKELCRRIAFAMSVRQLSQSEVARRLGCQQSVVSEWVAKFRAPSALYFIRMPEALEVDGHWLLTGEGDLDRVQLSAKDMPAHYARGGLAALARVESVLSETRNDLLAQDAAIQRAATAARVAEEARAAAPHARGTAAGARRKGTVR